MKENLPQINSKDKNFPKNYLAELEKYSVPEPVGKTVKVREGGQRIIGTIANFIALDFSIDNGCRIEYEGYADAAKSHMKENLIPKLKLEIIKYRRKIENVALKERPEKNFELLQKINENKIEWEILLSEIDVLLEFCLENFIMEKINGKFFPQPYFRFYCIVP